MFQHVKQDFKKAVKWYFEHYSAFYDGVVKSQENLH